MCVVTPMLLAAGLAAGGSVTGSMIQAGAANKAAKVQSAAADKAAAAQQATYEDIKSNLQPYMTAGEKGLEGVEGLLGFGGDAGSIQSYLASTPGYQFALQQGLMATQNAYAAKGLGSSGAALKGAAEYAQGLASQTYQQQLANMFNLAGIGTSATGALAGYGMQSTQAANNALLGGATATASGIVGGANALAGGLSGATSALAGGLTTNYMMQNGLYGPLGGGAGNMGSASTGGVPQIPGWSFVPNVGYMQTNQLMATR